MKPYNDPQFFAKFFPHVAENHISVSPLGSTDSFEEIHGSFLLTLKNERDTIIPCRYFEVPLNEAIYSNKRNTFWLSNSEMMGLILGVMDRVLLNSKEISSFGSLNKFIDAQDKQADKKLTELLNEWKVNLIRSQDCRWYGAIINLTQIADIFKETHLIFPLQNLKKHQIEVNISFENDFRSPSGTKIYLQVQSTKGIQSGYPKVISIAKFQLVEKTKNLILEEFDSWKEFYSRNFDLINDIAEQFSNKIEAFEETYMALDEIILSKEEFLAVILDLYDKNRNEESLDFDDNLRKSIRFVLKANKTSAKELSFALAIHNLIDLHSRFVKANIEGNKDHHTLFQSKKMIQKLIKLYKKNLSSPTGKNSTEFNKYLASQVDAYKKVIERIGDEIELER